MINVHLKLNYINFASYHFILQKLKQKILLKNWYAQVFNKKKYEKFVWSNFIFSPENHNYDILI